MTPPIVGVYSKALPSSLVPMPILRKHPCRNPRPCLRKHPTPVPHLRQMLDAAVSVKAHSERALALREVAETAVARGNYAVAIEAGQAVPSYSNRSKTLAFVAICAASAGYFAVAVKAADLIPVISTPRCYKDNGAQDGTRRSPENKLKLPLRDAFVDHLI